MTYARVPVRHPHVETPDLADAWHARLPQIVEQAGTTYFTRLHVRHVHRVTFVDALSVYGDGVWFAFVLANVTFAEESRLVHLPLINELDVGPRGVASGTPLLARLVTGVRTWHLRDAAANVDFRRNLKLLFDPEDREEFSFSAPIHGPALGFRIVDAPTWAGARHDVSRYVGDIVIENAEAARVAYGTRVSATVVRQPHRTSGDETRLGQLTYSARGEVFELVWLSEGQPG